MEHPYPRYRLWTLPAALAAAAVTLTGCGGQGTAPRPAPSGSASGSVSAPPAPTVAPQRPPATTAHAGTPAAPSGPSGGGTPWCATAGLRVAVHGLQPAAGNRYAAVSVTNTSSHSCRTQGYPGLQLVDGAGHPVPTTVVREPAATARPLTLTPGASAWARLHWSAVAGPGDATSGSCQPVAASAEVTPPDQTAHATVSWGLGAVCRRGRIDELPLTAGTAPAF